MRAKICVLQQHNLGQRILASKMNLSPTPTPLSAATVFSKAAILLLLLHNLCPGFMIQYCVSCIVLKSLF